MMGFANQRTGRLQPRRVVVTKWAALALALAFVVACPTVVPAQVAPFDQALPFEASYDGRWGGQQNGSDMLVQAVGFGRATFLPVSWAYFNPVFDLSSAPDITVSGTFELAGPDANFIDGNFEGQATVPDEAGNSFITATYTITGGEGQFTDVQGSGTLTGVVNVNDLTSSISLSGEILPPQNAQS
jgi:hypothetical protein